MKKQKQIRNQIFVTLLLIYLVYFISGCEVNSGEIAMTIIHPLDAKLTCENQNHIFGEGFSDTDNSISYTIYAITVNDLVRDHCGYWKYYAYEDEENKITIEYTGEDGRRYMQKKDEAEDSKKCTHYDMENNDWNLEYFLDDNVPRQEAETGNVELNNDGTTITATYTHRVENPCVGHESKILMKKKEDGSNRATKSHYRDTIDDWNSYNNEIEINPGSQYCEGSESSGYSKDKCSSNEYETADALLTADEKNIPEELHEFIEQAIESSSHDN